MKKSLSFLIYIYIYAYKSTLFKNNCNPLNLFIMRYLILVAITMSFLLTSCDSSSISTSESTDEINLNKQEQAFIDNIGEIHNLAIKKLYEKHGDEISHMINSSEGLNKMANIILNEAMKSDLWTIQKDPNYDISKIVKPIEALFLGEKQLIDNHEQYKNYLLFNLDNMAYMSSRYSSISDYKKNIPNLVKDVDNRDFIPSSSMEIMMNNVMASSSRLWKNSSLISNSENVTNRFTKSTNTYFSKTTGNITFSSNEEDESYLDGFVCRNGTIIADAEGLMIGSIGGGFIGGVIGTVVGSVVYNEVEHNSGICEEEEVE